MDLYPPHRLHCSPAGFLPWNSQKEHEAVRGGFGSWALSVSDLGAMSHLPSDTGWCCSRQTSSALSGSGRQAGRDVCRVIAGYMAGTLGRNKLELQ